MLLRIIINKLLSPFGYKLILQHHDQLTYQHDYGAGGYEKYRKTQIFHNERKLDHVWADEATLKFIAEYAQRELSVVTEGLCHGTRNGFEQKTFARFLGCPVIGTDISPTATSFPSTAEWDFHEAREDWRGRFSFVYSNSLDQAFDPRRALTTWVEQLQPGGLVFIEHTMTHSPSHAGEMDPFGAHPMVMPWLIFNWGRGAYRLKDILEPSHKKFGSLQVWIFVIEREGKA